MGSETLTRRDVQVLSSLELEAERFAAWSRLAAVGAVGAALLPVTVRDGPDLIGAVVVGTNLGVSLLGVLLSRGPRLRGWVPWALGLFDVVFLLTYVTALSRYEGTLPGQFKPAIVETWAFFLALILSAIRGRPGLLLVQTALFAGGLALAVASAPRAAAAPAELFRDLAVVFGPGENTARVALLAVAGTVLAVATARARADLHRAIVASRRASALSSFLAPAVASVVADTELEALREGRQQEVAILFADVRGFTALSETLAPRDVAGFLTDFRRRAAAAIEREGGVVDKFIGDEVMGLFGVSASSPDDARRAVRAGQRLLAAMRAWNGERRRDGFPPVRIGIGVHHGPVFVGAVGEGRLEFTVLGDTVNVARRLEQLTKVLGHDLLVTSAAHRASEGSRTIDRHWVTLPDQTLPGHRDPVSILAFQGRRGRTVWT